MRPVALPLLLLGVSAAAILCGEGALASPDAGPDGALSRRDCVQWWPEARMQAYGYNHIVHLRNLCDAPAECIVTTDVNPEPSKVSVAPGRETEVNTFLGSPARVFVPKVACVSASK